MYFGHALTFVRVELHADALTLDDDIGATATFFIAVQGRGLRCLRLLRTSNEGGATKGNRETQRGRKDDAPHVCPEGPHRMSATKAHRGSPVMRLAEQGVSGLEVPVNVDCIVGMST